MSKIEDVKNMSRGEMLAEYGTHFSANASPEDLVERCDEQLSKCKRWMKNLESLKASANARVIDEKKADVRTFLLTLSEEERLSLLVV